jgi:hypothetical protein
MTAEVDRPEAASSGSSSPVPGAGAVVPAVDAPPETQAVSWRHRHLLDVDALTRPELSGVLFSAATPRDVTRLARSLERGPLAEGEEAYMREVARYAP